MEIITETQPVGLPEGMWCVLETEALSTNLVKATLSDQSPESRGTWECPIILLSKNYGTLINQVFEGEGKNILQSSPFPVPDQGFWYGVLRFRNNGHEVVCYFRVQEGIQSHTFGVGVCPERHAKEVFHNIVSRFKDDPCAFEKFLAQKNWLAEQIASNNESVVLLKNRFDPSLALACMERSTYNRELDIAHLNRLMIEARNGNWTRGNSNICFDTRGYLSEGQHRCTVCLLTNMTQTQTLAFGHEPSDIENFDRNRVRSAGDALTIRQREQYVEGTREGDPDLRGLPAGKEIDRLGSAIAFIETSTTTANTQSFTHAFIRQYRESIKWFFTAAGSCTRTGGLMSNKYTKVAFITAHHKNPEKINKALLAVINNDGLTTGTALHTLHGYLQDQITAKGEEKDGALPFSRRIYACLHFYLEDKGLERKNLSYLAKANCKTDYANFFKLDVSEQDRQVSGITKSFLPELNWGMDVRRTATISNDHKTNPSTKTTRKNSKKRS